MFLRSRTTYLKMIINSYFELFYKLRNIKKKNISALDELTLNIEILNLNLFSLITKSYNSTFIYLDYKSYTSMLKRLNYIF